MTNKQLYTKVSVQHLIFYSFYILPIFILFFIDVYQHYLFFLAYTTIVFFDLLFALIFDTKFLKNASNFTNASRFFICTGSPIFSLFPHFISLLSSGFHNLFTFHHHPLHHTSTIIHLFQPFSTSPLSFHFTTVSSLTNFHRAQRSGYQTLVRYGGRPRCWMI